MIEYTKPGFFDRIVEAYSILRKGTSPRIRTLEAQAAIDGLTRLWNRRAFDLRLHSVIYDRRRDPDNRTNNRRSKKNPDRRENQLELLLTIADIDNFKLINDEYGHPAGDHVIIGYANRLKEEVRSQESQIFRIGGEEFSIISLTSISALILAERLVRGINSRKFVSNGVTTSIGIAVYDIKEPISAEEFYKRADKALYKSKIDGRNRATIWTPQIK